MDLPLSQIVNFRDIVDESDRKSLEAFKYEGKDDSIIYQYFTSPFCQLLVDRFVPERVAPNLITLVGLQFVLVPHLLIIWSAPADEDVPLRVLYLLNALGTFWYSIFDNIDGKQARKTNQASPLGMIFDHGCDALNSVLNGMAISKLFCVPLWLQAVALVLVTSAFYFATLEQYYTHYFYLPRVNAVNEGIMLLVLLSLFGAVMGGSVWSETWFFGLANSWLFLGVLAVATQATNAGNVSTILDKKGHSLEHVAKKCRLFFALALALLASQRFAWPGEATRADLYTFGFVFTKVTVTMQISHVLKKEFQPERFDTLGVFAFWIFTVAARAVFGTPARMLGPAAALLAFGDLSRFVLVLSFRLAKMLEIQILSYSPRKK